MMKKLLSVFLALCFVFLLASCANVGDETSSSDTKAWKYPYIFEAEVLDVFSKSLLVKTDDPRMLSSSDQYRVSLPEGVSAEDFFVGDRIMIQFDGTIRETYPAQIDALVISHANR